jgi:hypothetical protein
VCAECEEQDAGGDEGDAGGHGLGEWAAPDEPGKDGGERDAARGPEAVGDADAMPEDSVRVGRTQARR